ncbi:uncharacterized protein A1O5_01771 [Cladophialophora psammophila CBS 110553]|uniref:Clr5 domain-containing protein n=1 Tax=Cladophialophora psammophila CBS 110553 TaxID=1182543 RepID=W9XCN1_9EURO|nr:uncharacterized protein A1O5_01771 [Cladophialophora psammophila CBS 110553]EXJ75075.1 hypothetical protein A1O5_01771 [Cladophialophora psammophila CBS 110553]
MATRGASPSYQNAPTEAEWSFHQDDIIQYFEKMKLSEVRKVMERDYGFVASKRMYETRLKAWGVRKNTSAIEKKNLLSRIIVQCANNQSRKITEIEILPTDLHKLERYVNKDSTKQYPEVPHNNCHIVFDARYPGQRSPAHVRVKIAISRNHTSGRPKMRMKILSRQPDQPTSPGNGSFDYDISPSFLAESDVDTTNPPCSKVVPEDTTWNDQIHYYWIYETSLPLDSLPICSDEFSFALILQSVKSHLKSQFSRQATDSIEYRDGAFDLTAAAFWRDIKYAISLLKRQSLKAWETLREAGKKVDLTISPEPRCFMGELFATTSPVNTKVCPGLRTVLLQLLWKESYKKLGVQHPFSIVCFELQKGDTHRGQSEQAIKLVRDLFAQHLDPLHPETLRWKRAEITLLRRDGELDSARRLCLQLLDETRSNPNTCTKQSRIVLNELIKMYMDAKEYDLAARCCIEGIGDAVKELGVNFPDDCAVRMMEDMADIAGLRGDTGGQVFWLHQAKLGSQKTRSRSFTTGFIDESLQQLQPTSPAQLQTRGAPV